MDPQLEQNPSTSSVSEHTENEETSFKKKQQDEQEKLNSDPLGIGHLFEQGQLVMQGYQNKAPVPQEDTKTTEPTSDDTSTGKLVPQKQTEQEQPTPKQTTLEKIVEPTKQQTKKEKQSQKESVSPKKQDKEKQDKDKKEKKKQSKEEVMIPVLEPPIQDKSSKESKQNSIKEPSEQKQSKTDKTPKAKKGELDKQEGKGEEKAHKPEVKLDKSNPEAFIKSLGNQPPLSFVEGMKQKEVASELLQKQAQDQQQKNQEKHQVKDTELGLRKQPKDVLEEKQKAEGRQPKEGKNIQPKVSPVNKQKIEEKHLEQKPGVPQSQNPQAKLNRASQQESLEKAMDHLPKGDLGLNLSAGMPPKTITPSDQRKNQEDIRKNQQEGDTSVNKDLEKSRKAQQKDFGENEIYPKQSDGKQSIPGKPIEGQPTPLKQLSPDKVVPLTAEDAMQVNQGLQNQLQGKIGEQHTQLETAQNERQSKEQEAELAHQQSLEQKNTEFTEKQQAARKKAQEEVSKERQNWKKESDQIMQNYQTDSSEERKKVDADIRQKTKDTDAEVKRKYKKAERDAAHEKARKEREAARKKAQAKKDADKKGFWGRLTSAVKGFFDGLRKVLNTIFDALRKAVKAIIEGVKKAVNGLIELARKAIVGLIKTFGEALKKLVSIALAAFPKLAARINALIDKAVNTAVAIVNTLADALKKAVNALLDALGKVLDTILAAYQAMYNAVLDALEFIAVGLLEIMEGIANLVSAALRSPDFFWGQLSEELLGADITKPLPNEAPMPKNAQDAAKTAVEQGKITQQDAQVVAKTELEAKDVVVDPVLQNPVLSPELQKMMANLPESQEIEFGEQNGVDQRQNADELKKEAAGMPSQTFSTQDNTSETTTQSSSATSTQGNAQGLVGPFASPWERLAHLTGQMKKAVGEWWSKNKVTVIIGLIAGITGLILANIATGGAIMAALPLLLQIVGAIFTGIGILEMAKHFGKYLAKAYPGNIAGGAKSLARGLAALTIELIFALLFGAKGVIKGAKNAVKTVAKQGVKGAVKTGAKAAKNAAVRGVKNTARSVKELGGLAKRGGQALVKNGKMVFQGVKRGVISGAKTLDDVGKQLGKRFRFKKFSIKKYPQVIRIFGIFNPKIVITEIQRKKINDILESADKKVVNGKGDWKKYLDIDKKSEKKINDILLENNKSEDIGLLFSVEGHHAVPQWMGGPLIPYGDTKKLVGVTRLLHNFDWRGIHNVISKYWNKSKVVAKHAIPYNAKQDDFARIFKSLSKKDKKELVGELKNILDDTYKEVLGTGAAYKHMKKFMLEGFKNYNLKI